MSINQMKFGVSLQDATRTTHPSGTETSAIRYIKPTSYKCSCHLYICLLNCCYSAFTTVWILVVLVTNAKRSLRTCTSSWNCTLVQTSASTLAICTEISWALLSWLCSSVLAYQLCSLWLPLPLPTSSWSRGFVSLFSASSHHWWEMSYPDRCYRCSSGLPCSCLPTLTGCWIISNYSATAGPSFAK